MTVNADIGELPGNIVAAIRLVGTSLGDNWSVSEGKGGQSRRSAAHPRRVAREWAETCGRQRTGGLGAFPFDRSAIRSS